MSARWDLDTVIDILLDDVHREYRGSPGYEAQVLKQKAIDMDVDTMFTQSQKDVLGEVFDTQQEMNSSEQVFVYKRGIRDCVRLLKALEVL